MKIALLGYGKMGKEVERIALKKNHQVLVKIDTEKDWKDFGNMISKCDVAIDFSMPGVVAENIKRCFNLNVPVVVGTTGWDDHKKELIDLCKEKEQTLFYASNFSLGVNIFYEFNKKLASLMKGYSQYEPLIEEIHHLEKLDAPSGTAIKLANDLISRHYNKNRWVNRPAKYPEELEIISLRRENVPGTHMIKFDSEFDQIEIRHTAKNRMGFAVGAILAAEWSHTRKGVFEMKDMLGLEE